MQEGKAQSCRKSQGWEGWFTPAAWVAFYASGGKPPFPTLRLFALIHPIDSCAGQQSLSDLDPGRRLPGKRKTDFGVGVKKRIAFLQGNFRRNLRQIRIVRALRKMGQHDVSGRAVKALLNPFSDVFVGKMTEPRQDSLFQFPGIMIAGL